MKIHTVAGGQQQRLSEVVDALKAELKAIDDRRDETLQRLKAFQYVLYGEQAGLNGTGRRSMSDAGRRAISEGQRKRWVKAKGAERSPKTSSHKGDNAKMPPWTPKQDALIVHAIKAKGTVDAAEMSRLLAGRLKRTPGAVRQRIKRLGKKGILKENAVGVNYTVEVA